MAEKRKARSLPTSLDVHSSVHKGKPCNEKQAQYTHPATWKKQGDNNTTEKYGA